jgi:hypothetical protein
MDTALVTDSATSITRRREQSLEESTRRQQREEGRVYDIIQPSSLRILSSDHSYKIINSDLTLQCAHSFLNFDRLNNRTQSNNVEALTEAFAERVIEVS